MTLTPEGRPAFSPGQVRAYVGAIYGIDGPVEPLPGEWDQNFLLQGGQAGRFVVKIANQGHANPVLEFQNAALERLAECWTRAESPRVVKSLAGEAISAITTAEGESFRARLLTYVDGRSLRSLAPLSAGTLERVGRALGELDRCLADFQHPGMRRELPWDLRRVEWISGYTQRIPQPQRRGIVERMLLQYRGRVKPLLPDLPTSVIHNDANDDNLLLELDAAGEWQVAGLYDFGDMLHSHTVNELAIACAYAILDSPIPLEATTQLSYGYHQARPLSEIEIQALFPLVCMRLCVSVTNSAIAAQDDPQNPHRQVSDLQAWKALELLETIDWRAAEDRLRQACGLGVRPAVQYGRRPWTYQALLDERRERIGPSLSLSYQAPLVIVRGQGQFLFDQDERAYLDCVNNVPHVGHCHPRVVAALSEQAASLNTNTRYLHPYLVEYAERLTATLPEPLRVCFFVNSGSEANELAVRLSRAHTGRLDVIVLEGGYHGNTATLVDLSPYKAEGPGGRGLAEWAHKVVKPDPYRGPYRGAGEATGRAYAEHVRETCERLAGGGRPPGMFLCEPLMGCGGQIVLPEGYLRRAFQHVRAVGSICAVDEVQIGMGRVGTHMWAFETQDAVPDIITIGKPIGNGHPLGAVVTTPEIARSFANGMEYFSTFGGNPVSMAVGLAVLDVIETEGLRQRAERVGRYLKEGFLALAERHPQIGDVRGLGLFMGVELVLNRETLEPATGLTAQLVEMTKADGVLLSSEGPFLNVLKIKPPMQFSETDADLLLGAVERALGQIL